MQKIVIRHISGPRANQSQEFPASAPREIIVGRDLDAPIRFDPNDDLVSRQHAKIIRDPESPAHFLIVDLQSRNGTFLNRQRIFAPTRISHWDLVQLGPTGPEFRFEMDPPPLDAVRATRLADNIPALSVTRAGASEGMPVVSAPGSALEQRPIGRATVARMLGDTFGRLQHESNKAVWMGAAVLAAVVVVSIGAFFYLHRNAEEATRQARQSSQAMAQMGQDLRKTPEAAESLRQEIVRLQNELALSEARNAEQIRGLHKLVAAQQKVNAAQPQPPRPQSSPSEQKGSPAAPAESNPVDYDTGVTQAVEFLQKNDAPSTQKLVQQLILQDPTRWQAYSVAGSLAKLQGNMSQAKTMFEKALSLAPDDVKPGLQEAIRGLSQ